MTCCNCTRSPNTGGRSWASSVRSATLFLPHFTLGKRGNLLNRVVDVQPRLLCIGFAYERSNPGNDVTRAIAVAQDAPDGFAGFIEIG